MQQEQPLKEFSRVLTPNYEVKTTQNLPLDYFYHLIFTYGKYKLTAESPSFQIIFLTLKY